jgi:hypothetical protein
VGLKAGLDGCGKSRPHGIHSPDRPARNQWLYRLSYPGSRIQESTTDIPTDTAGLLNFRKRSETAFISLQPACRILKCQVGCQGTGAAHDSQNGILEL